MLRFWELRGPQGSPAMDPALVGEFRASLEACFPYEAPPPRLEMPGPASFPQEAEEADALFSGVTWPELGEEVLGYCNSVFFLDLEKTAYYLPALILLTLKYPSSDLASSFLSCLASRIGQRLAASETIEPRLAFLERRLSLEQKQAVARFFLIMADYEQLEVIASVDGAGCGAVEDKGYASRCLRAGWRRYVPGEE